MLLCCVRAPQSEMCFRTPPLESSCSSEMSATYASNLHRIEMRAGGFVAQSRISDANMNANDRLPQPVSEVKESDM